MKDERPQLPLTDDRSWSIADVAYFLNLSKSTVRNLERSGQLPSLPRIGRRVTFDPVAVRAFRGESRPPVSQLARGAQGFLSGPIRIDPR